MKIVHFLQTRTINRVGETPRLYEAGSLHRLRDDQARYWIVRGIAEEISNVTEGQEILDLQGIHSSAQKEKTVLEAKTETGEEYGNAVDSSETVAKQNSSDISAGSVVEPQRRRGRPSRATSNHSN